MGAAFALEATDSQRGILLQDALQQALQLRPRFHTELIDQSLSGALIHVRCFGLASRAVERQHQLSTQALSKRVPVDKRNELADQRFVPTQRQLRFDPLFYCMHPELGQASSLPEGERLGGEILERRPAP